MHKAQFYIVLLILSFTHTLAESKWDAEFSYNKNSWKKAQNITAQGKYRTKNYYFSSSLGNDSYSIVQAQNPSTPWKSLDKLNYILNILNDGDSILFKRGDIFTGSIAINKSENHTKAKITFGAYGRGLQPEINGLKIIKNWIKIKGNIWYAKCSNCGYFVNNLLINGIQQQIGRYPNSDCKNKGYLTITAHKNKTEITADAVIENIDFTSAEVVIRSKRWILERIFVKSQKNKTLIFANSIIHEPMNGFGFFIQNNIHTLDKDGEWFFDKNSNYIYLYSKNNPNNCNILACTLPFLIKISKRSNITIENITLNGASKNAIEIEGACDINIKNTKILNSGTNGIHSSSSKNINIENNMINKTNNNAIVFDLCKNVIIKNNTIKNTALIAGMGLGGDCEYNAVRLSGSGYIVELNKIDSVGHVGIDFNGYDITIKNNFISNFCLITDDGGGIYTFSLKTHSLYNQKIIGNIVINGKGAPEGTQFLDYLASGIYIDDRSANIDITDNTIYHCGFNGIYIHNANHINIFRNTIYDNNTQLYFMHDSSKNTTPITNCKTVENIFLSKLPHQHAIFISTIDGNVTDIGKFNHNYYCNPAKKDDNIILEYNQGNIYHFEILSLQNWKERYHKDIDSKICPFKIYETFTINRQLKSNLTPDDKMSQWYCWSPYNNGKMKRIKKNNSSDPDLQLSFNPLSEKPNSKMFAISNPFPVYKNRNYLLQFSANSSIPDIAIVASLRKNVTPYNILFGQAFYKLDTIARNYQHIFTTDFIETAEARIDFEIIENPNLVWIGNIELYEADATFTNINDLIKFEYNPSNNSKMITLDGIYFDHNGKIYNKRLILEPFVSMILFKKIDLSNQTISGSYISNLLKGKTHLIYIYYVAMVVSVLLSLIFYLYYKNKFVLLTVISLLTLLVASWIYFNWL